MVRKWFEEEEEGPHLKIGHDGWMAQTRQVLFATNLWFLWSALYNHSIILQNGQNYQNLLVILVQNNFRVLIWPFATHVRLTMSPEESEIQHNFNPQMSKKFEQKTLRSQKLRFLLIQFQLILCKTFIFLLEKLWNNLKVFGLVLKWLRSGRIYSGEGKTRFEYFHHIARSKKSVWKKSTWKN